MPTPSPDQGRPDPSRFAGRRVLVTGGLGFVGSHLAERLASLGAEVTIVDAEIPGLGANRANVASFVDAVRLVEADLRDAVAVRDALEGQEVVFDLAGQVSHIDSMEDPIQDLELNVRAPLTLLEGIRSVAPDARVVFTSTRQVYGRLQHRPAAEDHPVEPADINGVHKLAAERYQHMYREVHGLRTTVVRMTNTYGPRQAVRGSSQGFIPTFIRQAIDGDPILLFGGGGQLRDATHVLDVVDALVRVGDPAVDVAGRTYNLGGVRPFTLRAFAELLIETVGEGRIEGVSWPADRAAIDIGDYVADHRAITDDLGWCPTIDLAEGLADTVAFYRRHQHHYW